MENDKKIVIGIVGCGSVGKQEALKRIIQGHPGFLVQADLEDKNLNLNTFFPVARVPLLDDLAANKSFTETKRSYKRNEKHPYNRKR